MSNTSDASEEWMKKTTLGRGTFGHVTLWEHKVTHEVLAIKECSVQLDPKNSQRWRKEIDMLSEKKHPNLVGFREIPPSLSRLLKTTEPCLGMEHCEGGDLRKVLSRPANFTGLSEFAVLNILRDVSNAVQFLHSHKIIHRDLKPENILISFIGIKIVYKITDLGYAKDLNQNSVADSFVGTMKYVAPEVFTSKPPEGYTFTADFWSLGNVLFECITGYRPFDFEMSFVTCPLIPLFEEWLRLVMEWDPKTRGGQKDDNGIRMCYHVAKKIQNTKILHVFSVNRCQLFSFKMEESDTVGDLEDKLNIEFCMDPEETTLLLADGKILHSDGLLLECYNQPGDSEWLVYAVNIPQVLQAKNSRSKSLLGNRHGYQQLPKEVRLLVEQPDTPKSPTEFKRLWGHALYFISELAKSYRRLLQAQRAVMITLMSCNSNLMLLKDEMTAEAYKLHANLEMFIQSCEHDLKLFYEIGFNRNSSNKYYSEELKKMIDIAKAYQEDIAQDISSRITSAQRELISLKNNSLIANQDTKLDKISKLAESHLDQLLKYDHFFMFIAVQEKMHSEYLANLVHQIPTIWDPLESSFYEQLRKVLSCKQNMEKLVPELKSVIDTLRGHREKLNKPVSTSEMPMTFSIQFKIDRENTSPYSSGFDSVTNALTSIIEDTQKESVDPVSLIAENEGELERSNLEGHMIKVMEIFLVHTVRRFAEPGLENSCYTTLNNFLIEAGLVAGWIDEASGDSLEQELTKEKQYRRKVTIFRYN
eukprot:gene13112-3899_t